MSLKLTSLLPTLKQRLVLSFITLLSVMIAIIFLYTDYSIEEDIQYQLSIELEDHSIYLAGEYIANFDEHLEELDSFGLLNKENLISKIGEKEFKRSSKRALQILKDEIINNQNIFRENSQWIFLLDKDKKIITSSNYSFLNTPEKEILDVVNLQEDLDLFAKKKTASGFELSYVLEELPDDNFLFVAVDMNEANKLMQSFRSRFLMAYIAIIFVAIILCSKIIKQSLIGFQKVRETADTISEGDYQQRVEISQNSAQEVTDLSQSFNTMIDRTETLIKEIKEVTNNVAHDLRTPITRIRGKVETSLIGNADLKTHQEISGIVIEECDHLMLLIDNMLTLAEYESGLVPQKNEEINLNKMLTELMEVFDSVSEDKEIELIKDWQDENLITLGDPSKLQRAFANILDNAIKYSPEKSQVQISMKHTDKQISISFTDQGIGISEENQKRIFEPFYRIDSSRTEKGNGLGLNLAKAFVENQQGQLTLESQINKGSKFTVSLNKKS